MNKTLQAQAQKLYFQSDLSKTEISEMLGIPRRTLHYWIREKNWDRIKRSAAQMPSLLAENIYHIIARFTQQLLGEDRINRPITRHEADTLHKLVLTISKLKARTTLNESMEMFGTFNRQVCCTLPTGSISSLKCKSGSHTVASSSLSVSEPSGGLCAFRL